MSGQIVVKTVSSKKFFYSFTFLYIPTTTLKIKVDQGSICSLQPQKSKGLSQPLSSLLLECSQKFTILRTFAMFNLDKNRLCKSL